MSTGTAVDVVMPQMGVSVSEGTITRWVKQVGEHIEADETLLEISTDKVDTEVPSPASGIVTEILVSEGETVEVGTVLARIGSEETAVATPPPPVQPEPERPEPDAAPAEPEPQPVAESGFAPEQPAQPDAPAPDLASNGKAFISPVVARIAGEHGVDPSRVPGTGTGGRVTKRDILAFIESGGTAAAAATPTAPEPEPVAAAPAAAPPVEPPVAPPPAPPAVTQPPAAAPPAAAPAAASSEPLTPGQGETFEPMSAMRRGIAEHMRRSLDTSAHVTSAIEVDMSNVVGVRAKLKREFEQAYGVNPTYLAFIARATVDTLRDYPYVNGELRDGQIVTRTFVNLGFAVELTDGKGLIVPVVKNAETLNLLGMAKGIADIAARARNKQLLPDDVAGGTFTITNPGGYGTFHGTPVISQPQSAILGTYAIVKRPWVITDHDGTDAIAIRSMMNLTLTYDHRLIDGALAGRFLRDLRERLQTWGESDY
jgi:pyruvate dehydrogenase E2 component (dihydrolipoamide acetyltransferase)